MKFVFISLEPLSAKISKDWYINDLIQKNYQVNYWVYKNIFTNKSFEGIIPNEYILSDNQLKTKFSLNDSNTLYILLIPFHFNFIFLFRQLKIFKCKTIFSSWGASPIFNTSNIFKSVANKLFDINTYINTPKYLWFKILNELDLIKNFDVVFTSGQIMANHYNFLGVRSIKSHIPDYDTFFNCDTYVQEKNYAVFLDVNLPFHYDLDFNGFKKVNSENYLNSLNTFFTSIEFFYDLSVVIALHPSANEENYRLLNRKLVKYHTAELVKGSKFVISHHSRSISYGIIDYKPIIFIYSDELKMKYRNTIYKELENLSSILGTQCINIDNKFEELDFKINYKLYDLYKYNYVVSKEYEKVLARDIFLNFIESLEKS